MSGPSLWDRLRLRLRDRLVKHVSVSDGADRYVFRCDSVGDVWRAKTILEKEPGTVAWIKAEARPGDVFFDVGANIGLYSLLAARRVRPAGCVYAFEPHAANVHTLLHNVRLNGLGESIRVLSAPLNDREGYFDFHYHSALSASSQSQLHECRDDQNRPFSPVFSELKYATTVDRLVREGVVRPPDLVKIDVDGNEPLVLRGMAEVLAGPRKPRSIQVEIGSGREAPILDFLKSVNYELIGQSVTALGQRRIDEGADPKSVSRNAHFRATPARP